MATFKDTKGETWTLTITVGKAMKLKDELGLDVQTLMDKNSVTLERMLSDSWKIVEILALLLSDQFENRGLSDQEFFERIEGSTIDDATIAFLEAVADSLPKLKRRPMRMMIQKLSPSINQAAERVEKLVESKDLETELTKKLDEIGF